MAEPLWERTAAPKAVGADTAPSLGMGAIAVGLDAMDYGRTEAPARKDMRYARGHTLAEEGMGVDGTRGGDTRAADMLHVDEGRR